MDKQNSCLKNFMLFFHNILIALWIFLSTLLYGTITLLISPFSNRIARKIAYLWCKHLLFLCKIKVNVIGLEYLNSTDRFVFIANHQSYFDIPVLYAALPFPLSFIAKKELFFIPFFGWGIAAIGHIWIDRKNARSARNSINRAISKLKKCGFSLVLFPEGTRSVNGEIGEFKRGSFTLAIEADVPVVPVCICGTRKILPKHSFIFFPKDATVIIDKPLLPEEIKKMDKSEISNNIRNRIINILGQYEN